MIKTPTSTAGNTASIQQPPCNTTAAATIVAMLLVGLQLLFTASVCTGVAFSPSAVATVASAASSLQSDQNNNNNNMELWMLQLACIIALLFCLRFIVIEDIPAITTTTTKSFISFFHSSFGEEEEETNGGDGKVITIKLNTKYEHTTKNNSKQLYYFFYGQRVIISILLMLLPCSMAAFAAWIAAYTVCDPLVRVAWVPAAASYTRSIFQEHSVVPWSLIHQIPQKNIQHKQYYYWLTDKATEQYNWQFAFCSNAEHEDITSYSKIGRHSVALGCVIVVVTFPIAIILAITTNNTISNEKNIYKKKLKTMLLTIRQAKMAVGYVTIITAAMVLIAIITMNDYVWDWRPIYAALIAFGISSYLTAAFILSAAHSQLLSHECEFKKQDALLIVALMWLQFPLLLESVLVFLVCGE